MRETEEDEEQEEELQEQEQQQKRCNQQDEPNLASLLALPAELIHHILHFVPPNTIAAVSATCQLLRQHALSEQLWQPLVNENLPEPLTTPSPLSSFRALYIAHNPYWFLPRHRLWYADSEPNGKLIVVRYDPRRACIEGYAVVAERGPHTFELWEHDDSVAIHNFSPTVGLDLNQPVLKLDVGSLGAELPQPTRLVPRTTANWFRPDPSRSDDDEDYEAKPPPPPLSREVLMDCSAPAGLYTSFMLARDYPSHLIGAGTAVWPPLRIPAISRTRNASTASFSASAHRPVTIQDVSQNTFRLRKWIEFSRRQDVGSIRLGMEEDNFYDALERGHSNHNVLQGFSGQRVRMGETVATYGTLPPSCYTPTAEKPWRGIWCGDYSGHGCEFLLVLQPDEGEETPLPEGMDWMHEWLTTGKRRRESSSSWGSYAAEQVNLAPGGVAAATASAAAVIAQIAQATQQQQQQQGVFQGAEEGGDNEDFSIVQPNEMNEEEEGTDTVTATPNNEAEDLHHQRLRDDSAIAPSSSSSSPPKDIYTGRIEAIKLTGDPNIPRGQYTFIAPDIGDVGLARVADEAPFKGARVVRSAGHIAGRGFVHDEYMPSQLVLISPDRLAQFWIGFGHVSYYQRVNVDELLKF